MDQWIGSTLDQAANRGPHDVLLKISRESGQSHRPSIVDKTMFAPPSIARTSGQQARRRKHLLFLLLGRIAEEVRCGSDLLRPVWAHEAACRAANLNRLVHLVRPSLRIREVSPVIQRIEYVLATDLASLCQRIAAQPDRDLVPCSTVLREVISNLAALFEGISGVQLHTDIERIRLPAYKRRALVLAAAELVALALLRGCESRAGGRLIVSLSVVATGNARLIVADNIASGTDYIIERQGSAGALAELLEGVLVHRDYSWAKTVAEIEFPVRP
jgi:hypothetical protein